MKIIRWSAVVVTALLSLMNMPIAFEGKDEGIAAPLAWGITLLGVVGLIVAVGLALRAPWGRTAVLGVGALNLVAAVAALVAGLSGAVVGIVLSLAILVLGWFSQVERTGATSEAVSSAY